MPYAARNKHCMYAQHVCK